MIRCSCLLCAPKRALFALLTVSMLAFAACAADAPDNHDDADAAESADAAPELSVSKEALVAGYPTALNVPMYAASGLSWFAWGTQFDYAAFDGRMTYAPASSALNQTFVHSSTATSCAPNGYTSWNCDGIMIVCPSITYYNSTPNSFAMNAQKSDWQAWSPNGAASWALQSPITWVAPNIAHLGGSSNAWQLQCGYSLSGVRLILAHK